MMRKSVVNDLLGLQREINEIIPTAIEEECSDGIDEMYAENLRRRLRGIINKYSKYIYHDINL